MLSFLPDSSVSEITSNQVTALILAGGQGRRVGYVDKGLLSYQGKPLIQHVIDRVKPQANKILVSVNQNHQRYQEFGCELVSDAVGLKDEVLFNGPLAGILSGIQNCQTDYLWVVPCDAPQLSSNLLEHLLGSAGNVDVVLGKDQQREHYLFSLWHVNTAFAIQKFLTQGERAVWRLLKQLSHVSVELETECFKNINTLDDFNHCTAI